MKHSLSVTLLLLCICISAVQAQKRTEGHWGKAGYDIAYSAAATNDGGYILTGLTQSCTDPVGDIIVMKIGINGDTSWTYKLGGPKLEGGNFVTQASDGGYLVAGHCEDFGANDCDGFIMKLDQNGNKQWFRLYGGAKDDIFEDVVEMPDGSYVFAGITASYGNTEQ